MRITENKINIITTILYILCILIYDVFYCNFAMINGTNNTYNFSLFRIIFYIIIYIVYYLFKERFINTAIETLNNTKKKKISIAFIVILTFLLFVIIGFSIVTKSIYLWQVIAVISIILSYIFLIYVSNDFIKNAILLSITTGIIFSLSIYVNNQLDEKKHFLSVYSLTFGNYSHTNHTVDLSIAEIGRIIPVTEFNNYFNKYPENKLTKEFNADDECDKPATYYAVSYLPSAIGVFMARILRRKYSRYIFRWKNI